MSLLLGALCACQIAAAQVPAPRPDATPASAALVAKARTARYQQDARLSDYRALARQRWSAGIGVAAAGGLGPLGRMRLAARFESVARMGWHHRLGAFAELLASRAVAPIVGEVDPDVADADVVLTLPYFPGRDRLWPMDELLEALPGTVNDWISHPLDAGSDSLYRFELGGPLTITLPGGRVVRLQELHVRPVRPDSRLIVGSLWVDVANGALVRAAYRPSVPVDLWPYMEPNFDQGDRDMIGKLGPFRGNVEEIIVEHGLYAEQFWLPRVRVVHAEGTAKGGRITISIEQTFDYEHVRALAPGDTQAAAPPRREGALRTFGSDSRATGRLYDRRIERMCRNREDSTATQLAPDSLMFVEGRRMRTLEGVPLRVLLPCDRDDLMKSSLLPGSIYSADDELFTETDLTRLREETRSALDLRSQAEWSPQKATIRYGLNDGLLRFNRIEGLSAGVRAERLLGGGYTVDGSLRLGVADLEPNGEVVIRRSNGHFDLRAAAYRRLVTANDWGTPLGLSASLGALMLGHDDWMYHRTMGLEVGGVHHRISTGGTVAWRLFAERHDAAEIGTTFSFARAVAGFDFVPNARATAGIYGGGEAAVHFAFGADPMGTQLSGNVTAEVAHGEPAGGASGGPIQYARAATELRLAHGLGNGAVAAITAGAGNSLGTLPAQRRWYPGGASTIHAHTVGAQHGDAFWMTRAEVTKGMPLIRPTLFADVGWAGDRRDWTRSRERLWAAGIGMAALDGLVRFDVSRALDSSRRWSLDVFLEVR